MEVLCADLCKDIANTLPAIARREYFEQADKLAFDTGHLVAYNDALAIFQPLPGSEDIEGVLDGRKLYELLRKIPGTTMVKLIPGEGQLTIQAGRTRSKFALAPVLLPLTEIEQSGRYIDVPADFVKALKLVAGSCAKELSRPALTCIQFDQHAMRASDGYRVAEYTFPDHTLPRMLLPAVAAELLVDYEITQIAVGEVGEWARFLTAGGGILCARLKTGLFPDLTGIFEISGDEIQLPDALAGSIARALIFAKREDRLNEEIQVSLRPRQIVITAQCDGAQFEEVVASPGQTAEARFSIHPEFLLAALRERVASCVLDRSAVGFSGESWRHVVALR